MIVLNCTVLKLINLFDSALRSLCLGIFFLLQFSLLSCWLLIALIECRKEINSSFSCCLEIMEMRN